MELGCLVRGWRAARLPPATVCHRYAVKTCPPLHGLVVRYDGADTQVRPYKRGGSPARCKLGDA